MRQIETTFDAFGAKLLLIGLKGENNATEILIDCADALEEYQGTMAAMSITAPDGTVYPGDITLDEDGIVHWVVPARDCSIEGHGSARVDLVDDDGTVVASAEATTIIVKTNMQNIAPEQITDWTAAASVALQEVRAALVDLIDATQTALSYLGESEDSSTASAAHTAGTYLIYDGKLYKVTADIAIGDTLAETGDDANIEQVSDGVMAEMISLLANKADKQDTVLDTTLSRGRKGNTTAGNHSIAFGDDTEASGTDSAAFNNNTKASGANSTAHGLKTVASGNSSFAAGNVTSATGANSHAEGDSSVASGTSSHAEGDSDIAYVEGHYVHVGSEASGVGSHAEGHVTKASGKYSHSEGKYTIANHASQHVAGEYNIEDPSNAASSTRGTYVEIIGNGDSNLNRSNARTLDWQGNEELAGDLTVFKGTQQEVGLSQVAENVNNLNNDVNNAQNAIALTEGNSTASAAHATGSYLIYDGKLYKVTADIAIGDTLATTGEGANIVQVPGGATGEIAQLKSAINEQVDSTLTIALGGEGKYIGTDGVPHNNANVSSYTDYIDVVPGATVTLNGVYLSGSSRACCVYDADESNPVVVASNTNNTTITFIVPDGKYKCRTTIAYGGSISGSMSYHIDKIALLEDRVSILGNDTLKTTAQTVTGAINELHGGLVPLEDVPEEIAEVKNQLRQTTTDLLLKETKDNRALKADGYVAVDNTSEIKVYYVTAGTIIHIKASADNPGVFQFQTSNIIPASGTQNIVGSTYTSAFDDYIIVPSGALYLCVSQLKTNTTNRQKNAEYTIPSIQSDIQGIGEMPIYAGAISKTNDIVIPKMISWDGTYVLDAITDGATTKKKVQGICSDEERYLFWAALGADSQPPFVSKWDTALNKRKAVNLNAEISYGHCNDIAFIPKDFAGLDSGNVDRLYIVGLGQNYSGDDTYPIFVVDANTLEYITKFSTSTLLDIDGFVGVRSVTSNRHRGKIVAASYCTAGCALLIYDADGTLERYCTYTGTLGGGLHCDDNYIYVNSASTGNDGNIDYFDWNLNPITRGHFKDFEYEFEGLAQIGEVVYGSWNQAESEREGLVITRGRVSRNFFFPSNTSFPQNAGVSNVQVYIQD